MDLIDQLRHSFREALNLPQDRVVDMMHFQTNPEWDSVAHMRLIAGIESEFGVMFTTDQILDMSSFERAKALLEDHGVKLQS